MGLWIGSGHADSGHPDSPETQDLSATVNASPGNTPQSHPNDLSEAARPGGEGEDLDPLPPNWEKSYTYNGNPYFKNHMDGTVQFHHPQKKGLEECKKQELSFTDNAHHTTTLTYSNECINTQIQQEIPVQVPKYVNHSASNQNSEAANVLVSPTLGKCEPAESIEMVMANTLPNDPSSSSSPLLRAKHSSDRFKYYKKKAGFLISTAWCMHSKDKKVAHTSHTLPT